MRNILSCVFQKFLRKLKSWLDECKAVELSDSVEDSEELIDGHDSLKETYQLAYSIAMNDGQQLREGLMHNMSTTTGGTPTHSSLSAHLQRVQVSCSTSLLYISVIEYTTTAHSDAQRVAKTLVLDLFSDSLSC